MFDNALEHHFQRIAVLRFSDLGRTGQLGRSTISAYVGQSAAGSGDWADWDRAHFRLSLHRLVESKAAEVSVAPARRLKLPFQEFQVFLLLLGKLTKRENRLHQLLTIQIDRVLVKAR